MSREHTQPLGLAREEAHLKDRGPPLAAGPRVKDQPAAGAIIQAKASALGHTLQPIFPETLPLPGYSPTRTYSKETQEGGPVNFLRMKATRRIRYFHRVGASRLMVAANVECEGAGDGDQRRTKDSKRATRKGWAAGHSISGWGSSSWNPTHRTRSSPDPAPCSTQSLVLQ